MTIAITIKQLRKAKACLQQITQFEERFGEKLVLNDVEHAIEVATANPDFAVGWAAENLLNGKQLEWYKEAEAPLWTAYEESIAPLLVSHKEAVAPLWEAYKEATAPLRESHKEAVATLWEAYTEAVAPLREAYTEAVAPLREAHKEAKSIEFAKALFTERN